MFLIASNDYKARSILSLDTKPNTEMAVRIMQNFTRQKSKATTKMSFISFFCSLISKPTVEKDV